ELALGVHAANNLYSVLVANYSVTALPSPSLFTVQVVDAAYGLISALVGMALFVALVFRPWRAKPVESRPDGTA
ncbi:MAG TPA: hypothetical protein VMC09_04965, partial [Anaerolineales bacterium]|nr:hypothetical protein [Anaerolineales bacterium]